jgi:hypothetical protein
LGGASALLRADGTYEYARNDVANAYYTQAISTIYHEGQTFEVVSGGGGLPLVKHRQKRVDGTWEDYTEYETTGWPLKSVTKVTQPDGRVWQGTRNIATDDIPLRTLPDNSTESYTYNSN